MPSINMIAPRRAERKRLERDVRRLTLAICLIMIFGVVISGLLWARIYSTRARIGDLDVQLVKLQPDVRRIQTLQSMTKELEPKLVVLNDAKDRTLHWYNLLDKLSVSLPQKTWIQRITSNPPTPEKNETQIVLNGYAETQKLVGETMLRLYTNEDLDEVDLRFTQAATVEKKPAYEFEVAANLKTSINVEQKEVKPDGGERS